MKNKPIILALLMAVMFLPQPGIASPRAWIDNPAYTFESVPEGVHVPHVFILKNTGDTLLHINNVLPP